MSMLWSCLALAAFVVSAATPEALLEGCAASGGACEEADVERAEEGEAELLKVELLQQKLATKTVERLSQVADAEAPRIEFSLRREEFKRAAELIPQKLKAAGLPMAEFVPRFLGVTSATGAELEAQPEDEDFPLHFRYEPRQDLRQEASTGLWSRRRRTEEANKPQFDTYQASAEEVDFETLAANVYDESAEDPPCWQREEFHNFTDETWGGQDHASLHTCQCDYCMTTPGGNGASLVSAAGSGSEGLDGARRARSCALAISGSNDLMDWTENIDAIWNGAFCGKDKYHRGFSDETSALVSKAGFVSLLVRMKTCDRVVVIGHSLGGAVASLLATCINCQDCPKPPVFQGLNVEAELYTFGAPAVYDGEAPTNGHSAKGIFKGRRFWNYDMRSCIHRWCASWCCWSLGSQDPVPYVAQKLGYRHPKVESVGLDEHGEVEVWDGEALAASEEPDSFQWPAISEHLNSAYIARIKMHVKQ